MRPVNDALRQAKLQVALQQLSQIETRYSKLFKASQELESQWNKKVAQIESLGGQVASGLEDIPVYELPDDTTTSTTDQG